MFLREQHRNFLGKQRSSGKLTMKQWLVTKAAIPLRLERWMSRGMARKPCPDCAAVGRTRYKGCKCARPHPAGRCHTCHRAALQRRTAAAHDAYVCDLYGLNPGEYQQLYEAQGGRCFICQRATGATRRLANDHDHSNGWHRGLLCKPCNRMLGHGRDDPAFFQRAIDYLLEPPTQRILGIRVHKDMRGK